ncbi:hypothetical protein D0859_05564 [Hortaea werneckii]|uniref:DUF1682 domain protein n=2 Tax=Hortaea werneckii TaxID=91943 RepID=A0A3M7IXP6_HORWE|nr:hypothetical protein D0859_05564 [Hortaea werneckii]
MAVVEKSDQLPLLAIGSVATTQQLPSPPTMAEYLQKFLGGAKSAVSSASTEVDADFADFATAASPVAPSHAASAASSAAATPGSSTAYLTSTGRPYTKWYRVWERVTIADFFQELFILPVLLVVILAHLWGTRANRHRAKEWAAAHLPMLESEFASIGFSGSRTSPKPDDADGNGLAKAMVGTTDVPADMLREKSKSEYVTYCTGRQNVACMDIKLSLYPRFNPFRWFGESILSFFVDSVPAPVERMEATTYCFDGKEKSLVPATAQGGSGPATKDSSFDGFVFAIVHKDKMRQLRDDRFDVSLTSTKDHPKLPAWATVMSESAEVTEALLTPDLVKAVTDAGEDLEALIISDMPVDAPKKLNDLVPKKRIHLSMKLNTRPASTSMFATFLRLPDHLAASAHFRPEAMRKIKATREDEAKKIRRLDEEEKAEERKLIMEKAKREERDARLSKMTADEQRKFLDKEREKDKRRGEKRRTMKG